MDNKPEKLLVRAVIPNSEDPELFVLDRAGRYPATIDHIRSSQEELLHRIGSTVLSNGHLGIDVQLQRKNFAGLNGQAVNVSDIRTDPIDPRRVGLNDGYSWQKP